MQYDSYREKMKRVAGVLGKMYAHRLIITIALVILTAISAALVMTRGLLLLESDCPTEITYGEKLKFRAAFMVTATHYEYRQAGSNTWSETKPVFPGNYQVRAWGKTSFGKKTYTDTHDFTIVPREITLTVTDTTVEYGESPRVKVENLAKGDKATCDILFTDYGSANTTAYANLYSLRITDKNGNDRMAGYTVRDVEKVSVRFKPRPLTITVQNASKVFDDTALSYDGYEITKGTLLAGDNLVAVFRDTLVDAGTKTNTPELRIYNRNGADVTGFYNLTVKSGKLTVEKRPLIVQAGSVSYKYAGYELDYRDYTVDPTTSLVSGHYLEVQSATTILDCGTADNVLTFAVRNRRGSEETHNYSLFVKAGTLTVTPREVTVFTDSATLTYDGTDQSHPKATIENGVGDEYRAVNPATRRDVGSSENRMTVEFYRGGKNITSNYIINGYSYGTITVVPREITVKMKNEAKHYDGTPLKSGGFTVGGMGLPKGHTLTLDSRGETVFGTAANLYVDGSLRILDADRRDVTHNFVYTVENGTLTVNPRPITLASDSASKVYDGTPLSKDSWSIRSGSLVQGHELSVTLAGTSITDVGTAPNAIEQEKTRIYDKKTGEDVARYYEISHSEGRLEITGRPITVKTESAEWMYDAQTHGGDASFTITAGELLPGHTAEKASEAASIHNAGSVPNKITVRIMNGAEDITRNYKITYHYGTLTVLRRPIRVWAGSVTATYDGTPHTTTEVGLANDSPYPLATSNHQLLVLDADACSLIEAGQRVNNPRVSVYDAATRTYVTPNYEISLRQGTITVEKRPLHVQLNGEKIYDGKPLTVSDWHVDYLNGTSLASGHVLSAMPSNELWTDADSRSSSIHQSTLTIKDAYGNDVKYNYDLTYYKGTLTIQKRPITLMTPSAEKVYDGTPLTAYKALVAPHSLPMVKGHTPGLVIYGSATNPGQYPNPYRENGFVVSNESHMDVTHNYELVDVIVGTLTIKHDVTITVTTGSATKPFDGLPLTNGEYTVEITRGTLPEGYAVYVDVTGIITRPGSTENRAVVTVRDKEGNDVTPLFTVDLRLGVLTVTDELQEDTLFGSVYAEKDGIVYLRMTSFGSYNGKGWNPATPYTGTLSGGYSLNLLPSVALKTLGLTAKQTLRFSSMRIAMLPYYTELGGSNPAVGSDTDYTDALGRSYDITYFPVNDPLTLLEAFNRTPSYLKPLLLGSHRTYETAYRAFVHREYLTLDEETRAFMEALIAKQGFDPSDPSVIGDVAAYIRKAARYDLNYDPALDQADNVAIAFLRDYREGVCVHYATAATLLYRALGIPARYTTGFMLEVKGGQWNPIESPGHAWVEVYVDGLGWIQVEVTGSANDPDAPDIPVTPPDVTKPELILIPAFSHKTYDGTPLYAKNELTLTPELEALLALGYTYTVRVSGSQTEIGDGFSVVSEFTLLDPSGKDVTDTFRYTKESGLLRVTPAAVEVLLYPLTKTYDGRPAVWREGDYTVISLPDGATLALTVSIPADSLGYITLSELNRHTADYAVYRVIRNGTDVTAQYPIVFTLPAGMEDTPVLTVKARSLELTAASETRVDDGTPLTNATVYITKGTLAPGHTLTAAAQGTQTGVGTSENTVGAVVIRDQNGKDVTSLYAIRRVKGTLTLLAEV